ncbi:hypothetical protein BKH43_07185 [Helicobacter sp. 13S00401-1]|uniref:hypothetical protein n=1 Tax=Helicobacter sp. 13S00401-1 TaxID=1905758 RepID=UPI000BA65ADB|nr:hypothetical protein [Helicobacter sp. 13S00401-1]PAF49301.1 hypothetical protein BKH43_07185 [Helicobacter sp. 13S00401-1]
MKNIFKALFLVLLLSLSLQASPLQNIVQSFVGNPLYMQNLNFIKRIFSKEQSFFLSNGEVNFKKVLQTLKQNGLLNLRLDNPSNINLVFRTRTSPVFLTFSVSSALNALGYSYFYISDANKSDSTLETTYTLNSESMVDPILLTSELEKRGYEINSINKLSPLTWEYDITLMHPSITNAFIVDENIANVTLNRVSGRYWLAIDASGVMTLSSDTLWRPKIIFFDKNMKIVNNITTDDLRSTYTFKMPSGISFILVSDTYEPVRLRNGIQVSFKVDEPVIRQDSTTQSNGTSKSDTNTLPNGITTNPYLTPSGDTTKNTLPQSEGNITTKPLDTDSLTQPNTPNEQELDNSIEKDDRSHTKDNNTQDEMIDLN